MKRSLLKQKNNSEILLDGAIKGPLGDEVPPSLFSKDALLA